MVVFEILGRNSYQNFSSKSAILEGAKESLSHWLIVSAVNKPFPNEKNIEKLLQYLKIDQFAIQDLIRSTFDLPLQERNTKNLVEYLENYQWPSAKNVNFLSVTEFLKRL